MSRSSIAVRLGNALPAEVAARVGNSDTAKRLLRPLISSILPDGLVVVVVRSGAAAGLEIEIEPRNEKFYWTGAYEPAMQEMIVETLCPGDTFWDVGAHVGFFTLIAARRVGPTGAVHGFEPSDVNRTRLTANIARNGFSNVIIHLEAVSDRIGTAEFVAHASSSMGRISMDALPRETHAVPVTMLDRVLETSGKAPRLIKLDAEGMELAILRGAQTLLANQTTAWLVEVHEPDDRQLVLDVFESFAVQELDSNHILASPKGRNMDAAGERR